ncbi:MAG: hypothetical protein PWQ06_2727 [Anaerophaga sp.]|jgi:hypothetical protein|nr:hypothetical protein [Eubacteriaceae bacterium]MDN5292488.1 hypothetical protein [Anaerophaga sp.]
MLKFDYSIHISKIVFLTYVKKPATIVAGLSLMRNIKWQRN